MSYEVDFEKVRSSIKLSEFLLSKKDIFEINREKSTKKNLVIDNKINGEHIIIFIHWRTKNEMYFIANKNEKGDILSFIKNNIGLFNVVKCNNVWAEVAAIIEDYKPSYNNYVTEYKLEEKNKKFNIHYYDIKNLFDYSYLESRGLKRDFLNMDIFKGRIYNNKYKGSVNTIFPFFNIENIITGLCIRGNGIKRNANNSDLSNAIWHSNYNKNKSIDEIIIGESQIDVISYAQLKYFDTDPGIFNEKNMVLVTIDGSVRDYIAIFISNLKMYGNSRTILVNDYDVPGYIHDLRIMGKLFKDFPFITKNIDVKQKYLQIEIKDGKGEELLNIQNDVIGIKEFFDKKKILFDKNNVFVDKSIGFKDWNLLLTESQKIK